MKVFIEDSEVVFIRRGFIYHLDKSENLMALMDGIVHDREIKVMDERTEVEPERAANVTRRLKSIREEGRP